MQEQLPQPESFSPAASGATAASTPRDGSSKRSGVQTRIVVPVAALVVALLAVVGLLTSGALSGDEPREASLVVATATSTPTPPPPTPTATPATPTPIPTPLSIDGAAFPPPPTRQYAAPANRYGLVRMHSTRLRIDAYIEIVGSPNYQMDTPVDGNYSVGYYPDFPSTGSPVLPGMVGTAVFSAHETWNHMQGPFFMLHRAEPGDRITIETTQGTFEYAVLTNQRYPIEKIPPDFTNPAKRPFGEEWITLITCGGRIVYDATGYGEYLDRDIVIAKRVKA